MSVILRKRKLTNSRFSYYLIINNDGVRYTETLFTVNKDDDKIDKKNEAESRRSRKQMEIESAGSDYIPSSMLKTEFLIYCDHFVNNYIKADKKVVYAAVKKYREFLTFKGIKHTINFKQLSDSHIIAFADFLNYNTNLSNSSPLNYFKKFRMIIKQGKRDKLLKYDFLDDFRFRSRVGNSDNIVRKNVLTEDEIDILWQSDCRNEEIKKAFLFACYTGLGLAEIIDLKWEQIKDNTIDTKRKKNNRRINNAVSQRMMVALGERKDDDEYVFNLRNKNTGKPFTSNGVNATLKDWIKKCGIDMHITFYCGRHTFAIRLIRKNTHIKIIGDSMGHTTPQTTSKYLNHVGDLKNQATSGLR